ncbi:hypothetical protein GCM10028809_10610 [Spirosoma gilvum]
MGWDKNFNQYIQTFEYMDVLAQRGTDKTHSYFIIKTLSYNGTETVLRSQTWYIDPSESRCDGAYDAQSCVGQYS